MFQTTILHGRCNCVQQTYAFSTFKRIFKQIYLASMPNSITVRYIKNLEKLN